MKKRIAAALLIAALLTGLCACTPQEPAASSSEAPSSSEYYFPSSEPEPVPIPDYTSYIDRTANWIFARAGLCACDPVWAATAIEATGRKGTAEGQALLSVPLVSEVDTGRAASVAKLAVASIMMGSDPSTYVTGLDLRELLLRMQHPNGWFSAETVSKEPAPTPEPTPEETEPTTEPEPAQPSEETPPEEPTPTALPTVAPTAVPVDPSEAPENALEDTLWSMIALNMAGADFDRAAAAAYLAAVCHKDGSLAYDSVLGEIEPTALAILALQKNTDDNGKQVFNGCMEYLIGACGEQGFFVGGDGASGPNAGDQALGIAAVIAAKENIHVGRWLRGEKTVVDALLSLAGEDGGFAEPAPNSCTENAKALFALLCAQADSMIWSNYAMADIPVETPIDGE